MRECELMDIYRQPSSMDRVDLAFVGTLLALAFIPLLALVSVVARSLTPDRIEGFLWTATALCWLNALLLFALIRRLVPGEPVLALLAAALLIVNRSDSSRFFVLWTTNCYWTALFW